MCVSAAYPVTPKVLATALCGNNSMSGEDSLSHKSILVLQYAVLLCVCVFRGVFLVFAQKKKRRRRRQLGTVLESSCCCDIILQSASAVAEIQRIRYATERIFGRGPSRSEV